MVTYPLVASLALALAACWGQPSPRTTPPARAHVPIAPAKPRGMLLVAHVAAGKREPVMFWNDFDADKTGEVDHNLTRHVRAWTVARHAAWFAGDDEVLRVSRPPTGPGAVVAELSTDRIRVVSPDGTHAITGCYGGNPCVLGRLFETGMVDDRPVGASLPQDGIDIKAWPSDGRLVFQETSQAPTIWYVDPRTDKATRGLKLVRPLDAIADDGSLIAWTVELATNRYVVRWKRSRDEHEMSVEVPASSVDCRFAPVSHALYCVVGQPGRSPTADVEDPATRNRLIAIDPATGKFRDLANDVTLFDTHYTEPSPDGRFVAFIASVTAGEAELQRPVIADLLSGETFPAGPASTHSYVIGWLAPR
jgi:hypothetical protein